MRILKTYLWLFFYDYY